jgi:hypothetical protein
MPPRRELPLPHLPISLEALPPPESLRRHRMALALAESEMAMIEKAARKRREQPAAFLRTIVLTAFHNSALRALGQKPDLLQLSLEEQQNALLAAFSPEPGPPPQPRRASPPPHLRRVHRVALSFTKDEIAMVERAARERGEQPAVFCRTVILTAFQNSASRAQRRKPDLPELSPTEQQKALLQALSLP